MSSSPTLPNPSPELLILHSHLPAILRTASHTQVWGITLDPVSPPVFSTLLVLQKYLNSNANDVAVAREKLTETLLWRKEFGIDEPGKLEEWGADDRFRGLGFVTQVRNLEGKVQIVSLVGLGGGAWRDAVSGSELTRFRGRLRGTSTAPLIQRRLSMTLTGSFSLIYVQGWL